MALQLLTQKVICGTAYSTGVLFTRQNAPCTLFVSRNVSYGCNVEKQLYSHSLHKVDNDIF